MSKILAIALCVLLLAGIAVASEVKVIVGQATLENKVDYSEATPGKIYLILPLQFENSGYSSVDYNPWYCKLTIDGVQYNNAFIGYGLAQTGRASLDDVVTLKDGGKIKGYLGFEVPVSEASKPFEFTFEPIAVLPYNIVYVKG